ncbi:hypothetical protein HanRHA438_Chr08g0327751 [Helianthus annuus]|nr:hypothetical protein HanOQP8_Chr08g0268221 [Helianthus annuus]KAJ0895838.1 hypothetical protein HanRHA438_Chr08g0327751 [Helianthus annuus]
MPMLSLPAPVSVLDVFLLNNHKKMNAYKSPMALIAVLMFLLLLMDVLLCVIIQAWSVKGVPNRWHECCGGGWPGTRFFFLIIKCLFTQ